MSLDMTSFDAALKQHYTKDTVANLIYQDHPFLALLPKYESFGGKNFVVPVIWGAGPGRSATIATAITNKGNSNLTDFVLTRVKDYGIASIDNETLEASEGDANALLEAATMEIDNQIFNVTNSLSRSLFGDGTGAIGQVNNSSYATTSLDLVTDEDAVNFYKDQVLTVCATKTGSSVRSGTLVVDKVNRTATSNQITCTGNLSSGIAAIAQNDYIYEQGDYDLKVDGLASWLPTTDPSDGESFFGVDRSDDRVRLAGVYYNGASLSQKEAIINASELCAREGGRPDTYICSFTKFGDLIKELDVQVQREVAKMGKFSFSGVEVYGPNGIIKVIPDRYCPNNRGYLLQMNTWKLYSLGPAPKILQTDGLVLLREATNDAVECRIGYYAQLGCSCPGKNAVIALAS